MIIELTIPGVPVAQPRQRQAARMVAGKIVQRNYLPQDHPVWAFRSLVQMEARRHFEAPHDGPVEMSVRFVLPRPQKMIWKTRPMVRVPHVGKPDRDNLLKAVQDALEGIVYLNDSQVWCGDVRKIIARGGEDPHTWLRILVG